MGLARIGHRATSQCTMAHDSGPIIGMYADGDIGVYNRANRSLQHMIENAPGWFLRKASRYSSVRTKMWLLA
eukprot:2239858-Amphidinium_carterae.1